MEFSVVDSWAWDVPRLTWSDSSRWNMAAKRILTPSNATNLIVQVMGQVSISRRCKQSLLTHSPRLCRQFWLTSLPQSSKKIISLSDVLLIISFVQLILFFWRPSRVWWRQLWASHENLWLLYKIISVISSRAINEAQLHNKILRMATTVKTTPLIASSSARAMLFWGSLIHMRNSPVLATRFPSVSHILNCRREGFLRCPNPETRTYVQNGLGSFIRCQLIPVRKLYNDMDRALSAFDHARSFWPFVLSFFVNQ